MIKRLHAGETIATSATHTDWPHTVLMQLSPLLVVKLEPTKVKDGEDDDDAMIGEVTEITRKAALEWLFADAMKRKRSTMLQAHCWA